MMSEGCAFEGMYFIYVYDKTRDIEYLNVYCIYFWPTDISQHFHTLILFKEVMYLLFLSEPLARKKYNNKSIQNDGDRFLGVRC